MMWMKFEHIMVGGIRKILYDIIYIWHLKKRKKKRVNYTHIENKMLVASGGMMRFKSQDAKYEGRTVQMAKSQQQEYN